MKRLISFSPPLSVLSGTDTEQERHALDTLSYWGRSSEESNLNKFLAFSIPSLGKKLIPAIYLIYLTCNSQEESLPYDTESANGLNTTGVIGGINYFCIILAGLSQLCLAYKILSKSYRMMRNRSLPRQQVQIQKRAAEGGVMLIAGISQTGNGGLGMTRIFLSAPPDALICSMSVTAEIYLITMGLKIGYDFIQNVNELHIAKSNLKCLETLDFSDEADIESNRNLRLQSPVYIKEGVTHFLEKKIKVRSIDSFSNGLYETGVISLILGVSGLTSQYHALVFYLCTASTAQILSLGAQQHSKQEHKQLMLQLDRLNQVPSLQTEMQKIRCHKRSLFRAIIKYNQNHHAQHLIQPIIHALSTSRSGTPRLSLQDLENSHYTILMDIL